MRTQKAGSQQHTRAFSRFSGSSVRHEKAEIKIQNPKSKPSIEHMSCLVPRGVSAETHVYDDIHYALVLSRVHSTHRTSNVKRLRPAILVSLIGYSKRRAEEGMQMEMEIENGGRGISCLREIPCEREVAKAD